ncbi:MEDS domain-containing protein [Domibacillus sp. A3M-37]|uniref:MEDS domain-containing protein n=1 Tax=Domibacillus sp. A3M-37 TaxID=2962037 RepID=UPI0020B7DEEA|nr:MEDS domain-containing protein [Domibacillus sp. A3M-37]MCP3764642.1 MEDS domain-containing protein [Domibacillus sp. A3M-37]
MENEFSQLMKENNTAHIFYSVTKLELYINNLVSYILSGVKQGEHILVIENERVLSLLDKELESVLTKEQLTHIHTVNNFDYYFSSGSFHPPTIFEYLSKTLNPFYENNISFRIWAHVEWSEQEEILTILEEFENEADQLVTEHGLCLICAYDEERVPDSLKTALMKCHEYVLSEDGLLPSDLYQKAKKHS